MGQIITVASGKGGAGKSTIANGIARGLKKAGHRVLLVDTDFGLCSAELLLSGASQVVYHIEDVISGSVPLERAIVTNKKDPDFLAAAQTPQEPSKVAEVLLACNEQYDYVIVDRPAGVDTSLETHLPQFYAFIVTQLDSMGVRGAATVCSALKQAGATKCFVVINRFRPELVKGRTAPDIDTVCDTICAQLLGIIPEDPQLFAQQAKGGFDKNTPYGKAILRLTARLQGESVPLPKLAKIMK